MGFENLTKKKFFKISAIVVALLTLLICIGQGEYYQVFYGYSARKLPIYSVKTEQKVVAISFDCAWGVDYTDKLLEIMKDEDVTCTFFTVEFWAKKHPDYLKKISEAGHEIGTHSATHPYMSKLSKDTIIRELTSSSKAISDVTGKNVELFRPPYGDYNDLLIETAEQLGLYTIQWDVDSLDWKDLSASEIANRVVSRVKNGSIVLFHNQGLHTHESLRNIIRTLKSKGYSFLPIGKMIYKKGYKILPDGTQTINV